jgi:protease I
MKLWKKVLLLGLAFFFVGSFLFTVQAADKKALMLIAKDQFQDDEFAKPKEVLEKNGVMVTVASTVLTEVTGTNGGKAKPDILLSDVNVDDYDAILFIGGAGAVQYLNDPVALKLAQDAVDADKIVGAICIAPVILANAGVLKEKKATVFFSEADKLKAKEVNYTAKGVEIDGKIITADGPGSAQEFGEEIYKALALLW